MTTEGRTSGTLATWEDSALGTAGIVKRVNRALDQVTSTQGLILTMTGVMIGLTISTVTNYRLAELPARWWLVVISSTAVGSGLWVLRAGPTREIRFWVGGLWAVYGTVRSLSFLFAGSWSAFLAWLPCCLLGLAVFARRHAAPHFGGSDEQST